MSWFESLVVQPIFNILMALYSLLPGNDFGLALIIFAIVVRVAMWPLIKRQLHQTKLQRAIQPELKKIKQKAAGDRQLEGQLMLELYRERGISMTAPLLPLFVQLPVFIALYQVIMMVSNHREKFDAFLYGAMKAWEPIAHVLADTSQFNEKLLGLIDLTKPVIHQGQWYWPALVLAVGMGATIGDLLFLARRPGLLLRSLPTEVAQWSLTTLREKLVKIGARIVRHGRYVVFQLAEVAVPRSLFAETLRRIDDLRPRPPPLPA